MPRQRGHVEVEDRRDSQAFVASEWAGAGIRFRPHDVLPVLFKVEGVGRSLEPVVSAPAQGICDIFQSSIGQFCLQRTATH